MAVSGFLVFLFLIHAASSISLMLLNKSIAMSLPLPFHVLVLQNTSAIALTFLFSELNLFEMKPMKLEHLKRMLPLSLMYVAVLWTSLVGLAKVSVPTVVIGRSLIPLGTAIFERFTQGTRFAIQAYAALFLIFFGSALYATSEKQPNFEGIGYVLLNVILCIVLPVLEKRFVTDMKAEQTPPGLVAYRNITSMPVLLAFVAFGSSGLRGFVRVVELDQRAMAVLLVSCLFSFSIGTAVFFLQARVTATTIVTAGNWYKLLTLLASLLVWSVPFEKLGWIGITVNFAGLFWYSYIQSEMTAAARPAVSATPSPAVAASVPLMTTTSVTDETLTTTPGKMV